MTGKIQTIIKRNEAYQFNYQHVNIEKTIQKIVILNQSVKNHPPIINHRATPKRNTSKKPSQHEENEQWSKNGPKKFT